jgi:hypothetical protein
MAKTRSMNVLAELLSSRVKAEIFRLLFAQPDRELLGREINPHVLTVEEFVRRRAARDHFLTNVLASPKLFLTGTEHELEAMGR